MKTGRLLAAVVHPECFERLVAARCEDAEPRLAVVGITVAEIGLRYIEVARDQQVVALVCKPGCDSSEIGRRGGFTAKKVRHETVQFGGEV